MRAELDTFVREALPAMSPVIAHEDTEYGWRGLTMDGEVLEVKGENGHKAEVPTEIIVARMGIPIGRREVRNEGIDISHYLLNFDRARFSYKRGDLVEALRSSELAYALAPTSMARFNRAMILLARGDWAEGFAEYWECEQVAPFIRPPVKQALGQGLRPWRGEPYGRLLLLHAHGFGDSIMCLRYARTMDNVVISVPPELHRLTSQCGEVVSGLVDADFFCPLLHLPCMLGVTPQSVTGEAYLHPDFSFSESPRRRRIGVAWLVGKPSPGDYPRSMELAELLYHLGPDLNNVEVHSVQAQGVDEAERNGVIAHQFKDFTECTRLMTTMDEIISVDTAALHLAGAIGHPKVYGLLSHWASWRWCARWYDNVTLLRQSSPDDWGSALGSR